MIVNGKATIYRTRLVKLQSNAKFPKNPQASEMALMMSSLSGCQLSTACTQQNGHSVTNHLGSSTPTPFSSAPSGSSPLFGNTSIHFVTNAAIERTFARGPMVAAVRGMAVEANHHDLFKSLISKQSQLPQRSSAAHWGRSSVFPLIFSFPSIRIVVMRSSVFSLFIRALSTSLELQSCATASSVSAGSSISIAAVS
jgi:hypothetical protein